MENVTTLRTAAAPAPVQTDAEWHRRKNKATPRGVAVLEKVYAALAKKTAELWSVKGPATGDPSSDVASRAQALALQQRLILLTYGTYGNVIRFLCPLPHPENVFAEARDIL